MYMYKTQVFFLIKVYKKKDLKINGIITKLKVSMGIISVSCKDK